MNENEILSLIHLRPVRDEQGKPVTDAYGDQVTTETARQVFCKVGSIGQKEFYQAQAVGLQLEAKFILTDYLDYDGETLVEYSGTRYRILRTYRVGQELELTVYREVNPAA
jgi:SPP1 family predicted phage head-tail adaptor